MKRIRPEDWRIRWLEDELKLNQRTGRSVKDINHMFLWKCRALCALVCITEDGGSIVRSSAERRRKLMINFRSLETKNKSLSEPFGF